MSNMNETAVPDLLTDRDGGLRFSGGLTKLEYAAIQIMAGLGDHGFLSPYEAAQIALMRARELFDQLDKDQ